MALLTQANWSYYVQKDLTKNFMDEYTTLHQDSMLGFLYNFMDATQGTEYLAEGSDIGAVQPFNEEIPYVNIVQGRRISMTENELALGLKIQRKLIRNNLYGLVEKHGRLLAKAFIDKREIDGAAVFNNADNTTILATADTLALAHSTHTNPTGAGGANYSNKGSSALSAANIGTARLVGQRRKSPTGQIYVVNYDTLIVPPELHEKAYEIVSAAGKVDYSTNNPNYFKGMYNVIVWPYLSDTNNWFLAASRLMKEYLTWINWEGTSFEKSGDFDTRALKMSGYMSNNQGCVDPRWLYAQIVT